MARQLDSPELIERIATSAKVSMERAGKGIALPPPGPTFLVGESGAIVDRIGNIIAPPKVKPK